MGPVQVVIKDAPHSGGKMQPSTADTDRRGKVSYGAPRVLRFLIQLSSPRVTGPRLPSSQALKHWGRGQFLRSVSYLSYSFRQGLGAHRKAGLVTLLFTEGRGEGRTVIFINMIDLSEAMYIKCTA